MRRKRKTTTDITSDLQLGRAEVLRGLRNFLNMDRPEHQKIDHRRHYQKNHLHLSDDDASAADNDDGDNDDDNRDVLP